MLHLLVLLYLATSRCSELFDVYGGRHPCTASDHYLCGCHAVPRDKMSTLEEALGQSLDCQELCSQRACAQSCEYSVCTFAMGLHGEHCTTTIMKEAMVLFVHSAECSYNEEMMVHQCKKGDSVAYPNEQTYHAIMEGYCVPSCNLDTSRFKCQFESWFREETAMVDNDLHQAPFREIKGVVYGNADAPTSEPRFKGLPSDLFTSGMFELDFDVPTAEEETTDVHEEEQEEEPEVIPVIDDTDPEDKDKPDTSSSKPTEPPKAAPLSKPAEPSKAAPPSESKEEQKEPPSLEPTEQPKEHPSWEPDEEPKESPSSEPEESPILEPEPEESPVLEPEPDETPMPEPEPEESPVSEPQPEETPMSEPQPEETPMSEPQPEETPMSEPQPEETPMPEPEPEESPVSEPQPEESPTLEPEIEEPSGSAPEPDLQPSGSKSTKSKRSKAVIIPGQEETGNYTLYKSPFSECSQVCRQAGDSYKERSIICRDPVGVHVSLNKCNLPENLNQKYVEKCETRDCGPDYYFMLSSWSECPERCAAVSENGTVILNEITRKIECRSAVDNSVVEASLCEDLIKDYGVVLTAKCHSLPCDRYIYSTSEWGTCHCQTWRQRRKAVCKHWSTNENVDTAFCQNFNLTAPMTERSCYPQACFETGSSRKLLQVSLDRCDYTNCSTKGECAEGECECGVGFGGPDCQIQERGNACPQPSLLNSEGGCCTSGIFDFKGVCCDSLNSETDIDMDGNCCDRPIDACGTCSGERKVFDASGQCCRVMDASGTCCWSGAVDECGVCDGRGNTCNTTIAFDVVVNGDQDEQSCVDILRHLVEDALNITRIPMSTVSQSTPTITFSRRNVSLTTGNIWFRIQDQLKFRNPSGVCDVVSTTSKKLPICGNGFCEVDEPSNCPQDCDFHIQTCPIQSGLRQKAVMCNGHGLCSFVGSFKCNCFVGYEGQNCESCSAGFFRVGEDGRCIPSQAFLNRPDIVEADRPLAVDPVAVSTLSTLSSRSIQPTTVARNSSDGEVHYWPMIAAACLLFLLATLIVIFVVARKRNKEEEDKLTELPSIKSEFEGTAQPARNYDAMWQSFNRDVAPSIPAGRRHRGRRSRGPSRDNSRL